MEELLEVNVPRLRHSGRCGYIARFLVKSDDITWNTWCAAHPASTIAALLLNADGNSSAQRMPTIHFDNGSPTLAFNVRALRNGVVLNRSHRSQPCTVATNYMLLLTALWPGAQRIRLVNLDTAVADQLLRSWEGHTRLLVHEMVTKDLTSLVSSYQREQGALFSSLKTVASLELVTSSSPDFFLKGMEGLQRVRSLNLCNQRVRTLVALKLNTILAQVNVCNTDIGDSDIQILSELPCLSTLDVSRCERITNLNPLGGSAALQILTATECPNLLLVAAIGEIDTLRSVDLSYNRIREEELAKLLNSQFPVRRAAFAGIRLPSLPPTAKWVMRNLLTLSLVGADTPSVAWIARMPVLRELALDRSSVTKAQLDELATHLVVLETLTLCGCNKLLTSLEFVEGLKALSVMHISQTSIAPRNSLTEMQKRASIQVH